MPDSDKGTEITHLGDDRLVHVGAGAPRSDAESAHLDTCADCRASVAEIELTLAPGTPVRPADPAPQVWERIAAEFADEPRPGRPWWRTRWVGAVAAGVTGLAVGAALTAVVLAGGDEPDRTGTVATAALSVPAGTGTATGTATLREEDGRWTLDVDTHGLVSKDGYFEVWLLDASGQMYALGVLPESSSARLAVPAGISVSRFNIVDISAQQFNGNPAHSHDSVLRGTLRT
jgi:anti-sigma-K factor RskA